MLFLTLSSWILVLSTVFRTQGVALLTKRATVCNGHAVLCGRPYGNTTFLGSHDSYAFSSDPLALARDQEVDIPTQLGLGVRFLQAEGHLNDGVLHFCHTSCLLFDGGTVVDYLTTVKTWLDANPDEVLTLLFTNSDGLSIPDIWAPAFVAAGIDTVSYVPPTNPMTRFDWPTLGDMIDSGKRVITFMDAGADGTDGAPVDYILPEFTMVWEPPFDATDPSFPCSVDRIAGPLSTEDHLNMLNHNLDIDVFGTGVLVSDPEDASTTNGVASIIANANGCAPLAGGVAPNFVMLDFVNIGAGMQAVDQLNGVVS
ncbi:PLC-like phosphodiesterase [Lentinula aff. detonsa]|nr:PLC-like phosphodiesterase [Lentinula aff. detonsa]